MNATKAMTLLAAVAVGFSAQALTLAVKDVKMAQRYPWNGLVDIDYTVECDDKDAPVYVYPVGYDADMNQSVALLTLTGDGAGEAVKAGPHRMTWDMAKDMGENYNRAKFSVKMHAYAGAAPYMVVTLKEYTGEDTKYEISYLDKMPEGGWTDVYKKEKMVFRLIPPGTFVMGSPKEEYDQHSCVKDNRRFNAYEYQHKVTLTQPFYCEVFEITGRQRALIMGEKSDDYNSYCGFSYNYLRGTNEGSRWPEYRQPDAASLIGKLILRTGITFDLPTEAQWEYACRAGDGSERSANPNSFGLYGMNELPAEWCIDWLQLNLGTSPMVDPKGPTSGENGSRVIRGGVSTWQTSGAFLYDTRSAARVNISVECNYPYYQTYKLQPNQVCDGNRSGYGCRLVALPAAK